MTSAAASWNLADLFEAVADAVRDREAIVAGEVRLSFGDLDERANRLAATLRSQGIGAGDHVALALRNGHEYVEAMLAAFKVRAVPINVNTRYTVDELDWIEETERFAVHVEQWLSGRS